MKKLLLLSAALASSGLSLAQEAVQVISSSPILEQVGVPRQVCSTESPPTSGAAAVVESKGAGSPPAQHQQHCSIQTFYENRPVAYNVIYAFGGKQYTVQLPYDPGPTLQLQVTPQNIAAPMAPTPGAVTYAQPMYEQPVYVAPAPTVYPGYYEPNYFWPFALGLGLGFWGGFHGHGHWH